MAPLGECQEVGSVSDVLTPATSADGDLVDRAASVLVDDFARQSSFLTADQVRRTIERRHLSAADAQAVWAELRRRLPPDFEIESNEVGFVPDEARSKRTTTVASDGLAHYLKQIGAVRLLTAADEVTLKRSVEAGEAAADL